MSKQIGRAWVFGDDVDTDLIYHNKYLAETDPKQMPQYAFEYYPGMEDFAKQVKPGDFVVAGKNFGCGSSREQAPLALKYAGVSAVLAESFARIFYRNAINVGLPVVVCDTSSIQDGDAVSLDLDEGTVTVNDTEVITCAKLPAIMQTILSEGGLDCFLKKRGDFIL